MAAKELLFLKEQHQNDINSLNQHNKSLKENYRQQSVIDRQKYSMEVNNIQNEMQSLNSKVLGF